MSLTRAMGSAQSGLNAQQFHLDIIGNNLANATTTGFKAGRVDFSTLLSQTIRFGTAPQGQLGGINPMQAGFGVLAASVSRNFNQGALEATGVASDLAIDGSGFFILRNSAGGQLFTRDGTFGVSAAGFLADPSTGFVVQGVNANYQNFTIPANGPLEDVRIPLGTLQVALQTQNAVFDGNLNSGGNLAQMGTVLQSAQLQDNVAAAPAVAGTLLANLSRASGTGFLDLAIDAGDTLTVSALKGGRPLPEQRFFVGTSLPAGFDGFGATLGEFAAFVQRAVGINASSPLHYGAIRDNDTDPNTPGVSFSAPAAFTPSSTAPWSFTQPGADFNAEGVRLGDILRFNTGAGAGQMAQITGISLAGDTLTLAALSGGISLPASGDQYTIHEPAGVSISSAATPWLTDGALHVAGNAGTANHLTSVVIRNATDNLSLSPLTEIEAATGESVVTSAVVFDSIGNAHTVELTFVLESLGAVDPSSGAVGNTWRVFTEGADGKLLSGGGAVLGTNRVAGSGQIRFSTTGQFLSQQAGASGFASMNIPNVGAATPLTVAPDFSEMTGFADTPSLAFLASQDGMATGILTDFSVGQDGIITGIFTNGAARTLGQVYLARFQNPGGLEEVGDNAFRAAANSGTPIIGAPLAQASGAVVGGALEGSNVDFAKEFSDLIVAQRAFQANARVISRSDELLEELVNIV